MTAVCCGNRIEAGTHSDLHSLKPTRPRNAGKCFFEDLLPWIGGMVEDSWGSGGNASARILRDCWLAWALCDCDVIFGNNELTNVGAAFWSLDSFQSQSWILNNICSCWCFHKVVSHIGVLRRLIVEKSLKTTRPSLLSWSCDLRTEKQANLAWKLILYPSHDWWTKSCTSWDGDTTPMKERSTLGRILCCILVHLK